MSVGYKRLRSQITKWDVAPAPGYFPIPSDSGYELAQVVESQGWFYDLFIANNKSRVYPYELFLFSAVAAAFVFIPAVIVKKENKKFRQQKLAELNAVVVGATNESEQVVADQVSEEESFVVSEAETESEMKKEDVSDNSQEK